MKKQTFVALISALLILSIGCAKPSSVREQSAPDELASESAVPGKPAPAVGAVPQSGSAAVGRITSGSVPRDENTRTGSLTRVSVPPTTQRPTVGVTPTTIRLGFIIVSNNDKVTANYGVRGAAIGDTADQVNAVVDDVNRRGGILGRKIDAKIRTLDARADPVVAYSQLCAGFTRDDKVFAVLAPWNPDPSFAPCLAKTGTFYINNALLQYDAESFRQYAPYVVSGLFSSSRVAIALATGLHRQGFFKGAKVGVVRSNNPIYKRVYENYFKPTLTKLGVKISEVYAASGTSQAQSAAAYMNDRGITHVVFLTYAGGTALFFMSFANTQGYFPKVGIGSTDSPAFQAQNAPYTSMRGAMGVGWVPAFDVLDSEGPPLTANEKRCLEVHRRGGTDYGNTRNEAAAIAMAFCDMVNLFEEVGVKAGRNLTKQAWATALGALGTSHKTTLTFSTRFAPGASDGAVAYRPMVYDDSPSCRCFKYVGATASVPR